MVKSIILKYSFHILALVTIFILWNLWDGSKREAIRWEANYQSAKNDSTPIVQAEVLTRKELEQEFGKLANEFSGSTKKITHIHDIVYRDTGSTKFKVIYEQVNDTFYPTGEYNYSDSCIQANISLNKDSLGFNYTYTSELTIYGFWERSNKFPKRWDKPILSWGSKNLKAQVKSECGEIKYNKYIQIRK